MRAVAFAAAAIAIAAPMVDAQETPADRRLDRFPALHQV